ncbi:hypothetical protein SEA_NAMAGO_67 [Microbacterium phage Namago]|nr:hypothetical protein SEA_NAMAGO_67 [Microbacterium phage Namago]
MSATEDAIALLRSRVDHHRIGRSTWREMDHDIIAMRKVIELLEAPATEEERFEFAEFLGDLHDPYVTEGGCDFRPTHRGWRPGDVTQVDAEIVEPILRKLGRAPLGRGEITDVETCTWCTKRATGLASHNDGHVYPSCGELDHGLSWVSW